MDQHANVVTILDILWQNKLWRVRKEKYLSSWGRSKGTFESSLCIGLNGDVNINPWFNFDARFQ